MQSSMLVERSEPETSLRAKDKVPNLVYRSLLSECLYAQIPIYTASAFEYLCIYKLTKQATLFIELGICQRSAGGSQMYLDLVISISCYESIIMYTCYCLKELDYFWSCSFCVHEISFSAMHCNQM
jgi:hypothetical protein